MFPTYEMHRIVIEHMQRERLEKDIAFVDRQAELARSRPVRKWPDIRSWFSRTPVRPVSAIPK